MYKLVIQDDEGKTTVVPLIRDELTIGRKEGNTIRLTERNVSRAHARLTRANGTVVIEDLNSYNGIRVNGSRIQGRATIAETDRVQIGDYLIEIRSAAAGAPISDETQPLNQMNGAGDQETKRIPIGDDTPPPTPAPLAAAEAAAAASTSSPEVGLADTDPGRAATSISNHGRLVVLSTNFPGQEFVLDKPSMVIGRTDENDIWLNHRSISRHHSKILLENGRYSIEDLQSSNGVRVNGEEYGKVELRRADVIDLGHVRLRFIEPGEDFVFGRDAQPVEVIPEGSGKTWLYVGVAGALLIGAVVAFMMIAGGDSDSGVAAGSGNGSGSQVAVGSKLDSGQVVMAELDAAPVVALDAAAEEVDAKAFAAAMREAKSLLAKNKWADAINSAETAASLDPASVDAKELVATARKAFDDSESFKRLQAAAKARNLVVIAQIGGDFKGTAFAGQAIQIVRRATINEANSAVRQLRSVRGKHECSTYERLIRRVKLANKAALRKRAGACVAKEDPKPGDGDGDGSGSGSGSADVTPPPFNSAAVIRSLDDAIRAGNAKKTYAACEALKVGGGLTEFIKKRCATAACANGNASKAQRYFNMLRSGKSKDDIQYICSTKRINLKR